MADDDPEVDALFSLPVGDFVAARDRLAAERRKTDGKAAADEIRRLRRPTVVAWVLNQLARHHPDEVAGLLALGREAADAQQQALAGDASGLRDVDRRRRAAVAALVASADPLTGGSRAQLDEVEASLQAASLDPGGAGERLREGRLALAIPPASGFDASLGGWGLTDPPDRPVVRSAKAGAATNEAEAAAPTRAKREKPSEEERRAEAERVRAERRARDEARRTATERTRAAEKAEAALARLEDERDQLLERIDEARRHALDARAGAEEAVAALGRLDGGA